MAASGLRDTLVFGGGAALAVLYLHHRKSEDLDFFTTRQVEPAELGPLSRALKKKGYALDVEVVGPRTSLILEARARPVGRIDFAFYPFDPVGVRTRWHNMTVESLEDMTVNKLQAVLSREQPRDFVDLFFLLREGPIRDLDALLDLVRAKFDVGPHRLGLAARLLLVREMGDFPRMIRKVKRSEVVAFFEARARELARSE